MREEKLELSPSCALVLVIWDEIAIRQVSLDYTEHSPDGYYSDAETSIDLDEAKAREIVAFLTKAFNLSPKD